MWESKHYEFNPTLRRLQQDSEDNENTYQNDEDENYQNHFDDYPNEFKMPITSTLSSTPFGVWSIDDTMHPFRQFALWMGHTNFNIGKNTFNTIKKTPGVEVLSVISRYRFIIGIGKMFNFTDVRVDIENRLCSQSNKIPDISLDDGKKLNDVISELSSSGREWAIYVFPNGKYEYATDENLEEFNRRKKIMFDSKTESSGYYFDSSTIKGKSQSIHE